VFFLSTAANPRNKRFKPPFRSDGLSPTPAIKCAQNSRFTALPPKLENRPEIQTATSQNPVKKTAMISK
jgi:hypothetical protein